MVTIPVAHDHLFSTSPPPSLSTNKHTLTTTTSLSHQYPSSLLLSPSPPSFATTSFFLSATSLSLHHPPLLTISHYHLSPPPLSRSRHLSLAYAPIFLCHPSPSSLSSHRHLSHHQSCATLSPPPLSLFLAAISHPPFSSSRPLLFALESSSLTLLLGKLQDMPVD